MSVVRIISQSINNAQPLKFISSGTRKRVNVNSVLASLSLLRQYNPCPLSCRCFKGVTSISTLAVSLLSAAMTAWGDETGAAAAGKFAQKVGVVSSIIGFAAMIQGLSNAFTKAATKQVMAEAAKEGVTLTATEVATRAAQVSTLDVIKGMIKDYFQEYTTNISLERAIHASSMVFDRYSKNRLGKLSDKIATAEQELASSEQVKEENRSRDIGRALIKAHGELLHQDSTDKYDYQYESWNSPMHIGNVCRTGWKWNRTGVKDGLSSILV